MRTDGHSIGQSECKVIVVIRVSCLKSRATKCVSNLKPGLSIESHELTGTEQRTSGMGVVENQVMADAG
jgi:hypothetical protein